MLVRLIFLLIFCCSVASESITKRVYLPTHSSYVNYTAEEWKIKDSLEELTVVTRFKPRSSVGQIFSIKGVKSDGTVEFILSLSLSGGSLQVDLYDGAAQKLLNKPLVSADFMSQSQDHEVAVKLNVGEKTLVYSINRQKEVNCEVAKDLQWAGTEVVATFGGSEQSVIGCVTLVAIQLGEIKTAHLVEIKRNKIEQCPAEDVCSQRNCAKGNCLALEVATCDCYGTNKTGPNCSSEPRTVSLNNAADADIQSSWIQYTPWPVDDVVRRIAMQFRFRDDDSSEGVLVYGKMLDGGELKMYVVDGIGSLMIPQMTSLNFTLSPDNDLHSVEILYDPIAKSIVLTVDGATQKTPVSFLSLRLTSVQFGSAPVANGVEDMGLTACLRLAYVDHFDIIEMMFNKDTRVVPSRELSSCTSDAVITQDGLNMFDADPMPMLADFGKSHQSIGDEPIRESEEGSEEQQENEKEDKGEKLNLSSILHLSKKKETAVACEKSQSIICENGSSCMKEGETTECTCTPNYYGKYCQFVHLPRTCAELPFFHRFPQEGPTRIDLDSSEGLRPSVVECKDGMTNVPHDMPADTKVRFFAFNGHSKFLLSYRDMNQNKLEKLMENSDKCSQTVNYKCNKAPIDFAGDKTWFRVVSGNSTVKQMGIVPDSCQCLDVGCEGNGGSKNMNKCNCDAGGTQQDEGILQNEKAGVTSVVALMNEGDLEGKMSIGPLVCSGSKGESKPIRFRSPRPLHIQTVRPSLVSFQFRTNDFSANLMTIKQKYSEIVVQLVDGHTLRANIKKDGQESKMITVDSQAKLNDSHWHLVRLQWKSDQLFVSVDSYSSVGEIEPTEGNEGEIVINGVDNGFVGCIRSLLINDAAVDLHALAITESAELALECESQCRSDSCRNDGLCVDNFATNLPTCQCEFPKVQSGLNCEHDININSSVSFHGGFLMYEDEIDNLLQDIVLSFRTDQPNALLLFIHDQFNNFIQLHLRDEVNITLVINNNDVISSCTVMADAGREFGDMSWIQISIENLEQGTQLTVGDEACTIREKRELATGRITEYKNWNADIVSVPVGLGNATISKFIYTFVGGVHRHNTVKGGSKKLQPEYSTEIEDLLGCMRGFRIGSDVIDLRHTNNGYRPEDRSLVRLGCDVQCESVDCKNGGHCSIAWKDYDPSKSKTSCDCSRTSYVGADCSQDEGLWFKPDEHFEFDIQQVLSRYLEPKNKQAQTLKFSFATSKGNTRMSLANIYFKDDSQFEVLLNKNSTLNVGILYSDGRTHVRTFNGNFSDGYRHFFVAHFQTSQPTVIQVDSFRQTFPMVMNNLDLYHSKELLIANEKDDNVDFNSVTPKKKFEGCVSNIELNLGVPSLYLMPIFYLGSNHSYALNAQLLPTGTEVRKEICPAFIVPNQPPIIQNTVAFPEWGTNFQRLDYTMGVVEEVATGDGLAWYWILLIILLVLFVILAIITILCCCCCKDDKNRNTPVSQDELRPLQSSYPPAPQPLYAQPKSKYEIPPPDLELSSTYPPQFEDFHMVQKPGQTDDVDSLQSGLTSYYTANEELQDFDMESDLDRTLTEEDGVQPHVPSRPTGLNRSSAPQRMSSFKNSTNPIGSPLWVPPTADTPKRPKVVPSPTVPSPESGQTTPTNRAPPIPVRSS